jgi:hypothetical protein
MQHGAEGAEGGVLQKALGIIFLLAKVLNLESIESIKPLT